MATSGTYTFNQNRDQIIRRAARLISAIASGETPDAQLNQDFSDALNSMVKQWQAMGIHLWTQREATLFFQPNQIQYNLGPGSTDHCTETYTSTTTSAAANLGASTLVLTSVSGFANGAKIGFLLASGGLQWTTINGAPVGSTVTLAAVTTDVVPVGNPVYTYAANGDIVRPLRVINSRRVNFPSLIETPMLPPLARLDYLNLPNKTSPGTPTQFFYDPQLGLGQIYIWPAPPDSTNGAKLTYWRPLQDFNVAADNADFPVEWLNAIVFNLAEVMAPEFDCPTDRYQIITSAAAKHLDMVTGFDREPESIFLGVSMDQRG